MKKLLLGLLVGALIFSISCTNSSENKTTEAEPNNIEAVDTTLLLKEYVTRFYDVLGVEEYQSCLTYFSSNIRQNPGDDAILQGLEHRNTSQGISEKIDFIYFDLNRNAGTPNYTVLTRCFNNRGMANYDKIGMSFNNDSIIIDSYDYGKLPYYTSEIANDKEFELNLFLTKMYVEFASDDFEKIEHLIDDTAKIMLGIDKLKNGFMVEASFKSSITEFSVQSLKVDYKYNVPLIDMNILETTSEGIFMSNVVLTDRNGEYYIVIIKNIPVTTSSNDNDLTNEEAEKILGVIDDFYGDLGTQNYDVVMSKIDDDVFKNNDYNSIMNSFVARNSYYGVPTKNERTNYTIQDLDGLMLVHVFYTVTNSKNITSYETISILQSNTGEYSVFGYDFTDNPE